MCIYICNGPRGLVLSKQTLCKKFALKGGLYSEGGKAVQYSTCTCAWGEREGGGQNSCEQHHSSVVKVPTLP